MSRWLWDANLVAWAVLLWRLVAIRAYRTNPFLFTFFASTVAEGVCLMQISYRSNLYGIIYLCFQIVGTLLTFFTILELYRNALARHKGLANFGRAAAWVAVIGVAFVASVSATLDSKIPRGQSAVLHHFFVVERTVDVVFILFLLLIAFLITWFPIRMSRNTALSLAGFVGFYILRAAVLLAINLMSPRWLATINDANLVLAGLLILVWSALMRPDAANDDVVPGHSWDPAALEDLTRQLDGINAALSRFGRN